MITDMEVWTWCQTCQGTGKSDFTEGMKNKEMQPNCKACEGKGKLKTFVDFYTFIGEIKSWLDPRYKRQR